MREYQECYIKNLKQVQELTDVTKLDFGDMGGLFLRREQMHSQARELVRENTQLIRDNLFPALDDIVSVSPEEAASLEEFAIALAGGFKQLDLVLGYTIHDALITYARHWEKLDLLIQELYYTGLALFYMQSRIASTGKSLYNWKIGMVFGEAASYIRRYDELKEAKTRGFVHRAMANLALVYHNVGTKAEARKKAEIIRRSLQVLTDPVFQEKTPSLPWEMFITKSHQERTTLMTHLRNGTDDAQIVREVMESSQFVWNRQLESSREHGVPMAVRWAMEYEMALYHCGVQTLEELLQRMEDAYMERRTDDYSDDGVYVNILHVGLYAEYLMRDETLVWKKKEVLKYMYRMLIPYVKNAPNSYLNAGITRNLLETLKTYVEYPDGMTYKDFLLQLVVCRDLDSYAFSLETAEVSAMLMRAMIESNPKALAELPGVGSAARAARYEKELVAFAYESGMLHDVGNIAFGGVVRRSGRAWFEEEYRMYACHAWAGFQMLGQCDSTRPYAMTALGHNAYFNGKGGYPQEYVRSDNPEAVVTDIVAASAYLLRMTSRQPCSTYPCLTVPETVERMCGQAGERFSPLVCGLARKLVPELSEYVKTGDVQAYRRAFGRLLSEQA